jgi:hypothetical protein
VKSSCSCGRGSEEIEAYIFNFKLEDRKRIKADGREQEDLKTKHTASDDNIWQQDRSPPSTTR